MSFLEDEILSIEQASKLLRTSPTTLYRLARIEKFPAIKIGKKWCVLRSNINLLLQKQNAKHSFFSDVQVAELVTALKGRGEILQKLHYLGDGADLWVKYSNSIGYDIREKEIELLKENSREIFSSLKQEHCNLLDIGCGDGKKAHIILSEFGVEETATGYFPLDISSRMIEFAIKENAGLLSKNRLIESFNEDFEKAGITPTTYYLRRRFHKNNFLLFLGTTLGNCAEANRVLINLREGMSKTDYLLVGVAMYDGVTHHSPYDVDEAYEQLWNTFEKIGITRKDARIKSEFNKKMLQFEDYAYLEKNISIKLGGEKISFKKKQKILLDTSKRFTEEELIKLFGHSRLKITKIFTNKDRDYALVLCKPFTW